ncbi:MAG: heavy metal transporter [Fluviicola sp. XM-24bin1]|nr:MAG: heavy metal transporter [Fluviicola sp. XM-24bin1]
MVQELEIQNLKCDGCANTIETELLKIDGVTEVLVNEEDSKVRFESNNETLPAVIERLKQLGYPVADAENTIINKATSYVSCIRGRVS